MSFVWVRSIYSIIVIDCISVFQGYVPSGEGGDLNDDSEHIWSGTETVQTSISCFDGMHETQRVCE